MFRRFGFLLITLFLVTITVGCGSVSGDDESTKVIQQVIQITTGEPGIFESMGENAESENYILQGNVSRTILQGNEFSLEIK